MSNSRGAGLLAQCHILLVKIPGAHNEAGARHQGSQAAYSEPNQMQPKKYAATTLPTFPTDPVYAAVRRIGSFAVITTVCS